MRKACLSQNGYGAVGVDFGVSIDARTRPDVRADVGVGAEVIIVVDGGAGVDVQVGAPVFVAGFDVCIRGSVPGSASMLR